MKNFKKALIASQDYIIVAVVVGAIIYGLYSSSLPRESSVSALDMPVSKELTLSTEDIRERELAARQYLEASKGVLGRSSRMMDFLAGIRKDLRKDVDPEKLANGLEDNMNELRLNVSNQLADLNNHDRDYHGVWDLPQFNRETARTFNIIKDLSTNNLKRIDEANRLLESIRYTGYSPSHPLMISRVSEILAEVQKDMAQQQGLLLDVVTELTKSMNFDLEGLFPKAGKKARPEKPLTKN